MLSTPIENIDDEHDDRAETEHSNDNANAGADRANVEHSAHAKVELADDHVDDDAENTSTEHADEEHDNHAEAEHADDEPTLPS